MRRAPSRIRSTLALLALVPLGVGVCACGGSGKVNTATATTTASAPVVRDFGHAAGAADRSEIAALVGRYYAAAAAGQGAGACGMLFFAIAESVPEKYGRAPGPRYLSGADTCQAVLSRVFEHFHTQLQERPTVTLVRVSGDRARALLDWKTLQPGYVEARREGAMWKLESVLATALH
jgi:hypothetical protein